MSVYLQRFGARGSLAERCPEIGLQDTRPDTHRLAILRWASKIANGYKIIPGSLGWFAKLQEAVKAGNDDSVNELAHEFLDCGE